MTTRWRTYLIIAGLLAAAAGGGVAWAAASSGPPTPPTTPPAAAPPAARSAEPSPRPTGSPIPVIVPGRPGESASVVPADKITAPDRTRYNSLDVTFVRMMIPHHEQALELAALAPSRVRDPQVRAIAERIRVAQGPEISVLRAWLAERGEADRPGGGHDHATMPGMASPQALSALAGADGAAFDRMFVDLMSAHHQGAIDMCLQVLRGGADERLQKLATDIAAEQRIEISRMRDALEP